MAKKSTKSEMKEKSPDEQAEKSQSDDIPKEPEEGEKTPEGQAEKNSI